MSDSHYRVDKHPPKAHVSKEAQRVGQVGVGEIPPSLGHVLEGVYGPQSVSSYFLNQSVCSLLCIVLQPLPSLKASAYLRFEPPNFIS